MKWLAIIAGSLLLAILLLRVALKPAPDAVTTAAPVAAMPAAEQVAPSIGSDAETSAAASNETQVLHASLVAFLLAVKDPYRPPLGDNADITRALAGENRFRRSFLGEGSPVVQNGRLLDRWGTPYWFHPRAPDSIDIVSPGPDRRLFTADDIRTVQR